MWACIHAFIPFGKEIGRFGGLRPPSTGRRKGKGKERIGGENKSKKTIGDNRQPHFTKTISAKMGKHI